MRNVGKVLSTEEPVALGVRIRGQILGLRVCGQERGSTNGIKRCRRERAHTLPCFSPSAIERDA
jgi:hypothetical protein